MLQAQSPISVRRFPPDASNQVRLTFACRYLLLSLNQALLVVSLGHFVDILPPIVVAYLGLSVVPDVPTTHPLRLLKSPLIKRCSSEA